MHDDAKRRDVRLLLAAGTRQAKIAEVTGVSERTIRRIAGEEASERGEAPARKGAGRPSKTRPHREAVQALLEEDPRMKSLEVLRRLRLRGYDGGKSAVYGLVRELRPRPSRPMVRFEGVAGEFSQHDFGEVRVRWIDGSQEKLVFFASRLKHSRYACISIVRNQRVEALVRALVDHFAAFGGIPLLAVFDRPKTIVLRSDPTTGKVLEWNATFIDVMTRLAVSAEMCWPGRANRKGSVESLVGWVKGSFFKTRRFHDREDLDAQLAAWHEEVNERRPSRATGEVPAKRLEAERERLRPVPIQPEDLDLRFPAFVGPTGMVEFDGGSYSMPPEAISRPATIHLHRDRLRIVAGRHAAEHPRLGGEERISNLSEHRAAMLSRVSGRRGRHCLQRQQILELGPAAERFVTELVHGRSCRWINDVERLHGLLQSHGQEAMREAFARAADLGAFNVAAVIREIRTGGRA